MKEKHFLKSVEETLNLSKNFCTKLKNGDVIELIDELCSGKTTFTKSIAKALGINEHFLSYCN